MRKYSKEIDGRVIELRVGGYNRYDIIDINKNTQNWIARMRDRFLASSRV
jgi:hypothetical protein